MVKHLQQVAPLPVWRSIAEATADDLAAAAGSSQHSDLGLVMRAAPVEAQQAIARGRGLSRGSPAYLCCESGVFYAEACRCVLAQSTDVAR